ncbi:MAG: Gfo/Idh/MocA family oxidoreductase [Chloroflexota bacterium]|nr:Gfo/Idh/MocA family oxidoreductase [Chloroflexota bacterium]
MSEASIRVGIVGAGNNTRTRHIPGLKAIPGVEIVSVCNRSRESSQRVAKEFGIPRVYDNWLELVESDEVNAIVIGTWPYMHCPVTLAALESDKHVLCEARMAMNAEEAHAMLEASVERPHLATQIVPAPQSLKVDAYVQELVAQGFLGEPLVAEMRIGDGAFPDPSAPLHWRQDRALSGYNTLQMGIYYEILMRWLGPALKITALTKVSVKRRRDESGLLRAVEVPDYVNALCDLACGAQASLTFTSVTGLCPGNSAWLYGTEGTLRVDFPSQTLWGGKRGDKELKQMPAPPAKVGGWRVEQEFVNAIRGVEKVTRTSFQDGVRYMEFTEAVICSAQSGQAIALPL